DLALALARAALDNLCYFSLAQGVSAMGNGATSRTGSALLVLLRDPADPLAWSAFVERYAPTIYGWCPRRRLPEADRPGVTQGGLPRLVRRLHAFRYDPSRGTFRGWLRTVTRHAWYDYRDSQQRAGGAGDSAAYERLQTVAARDGLFQALEDVFDFEVLEEAKARVQMKVTPRDWKIFQDLAVEGRPARLVAQELHMSVPAVRMAKKRVQDRLRDEISRLEEATPQSPEASP